MKSKQLIKKVSMLALVGATVLGSGTSLFAKTTTCKWNRKPVCCTKLVEKSKCNSNCVGNSKPVTKPGCSQGSNVTCNEQSKPGTKTETKPETKPVQDNNTGSNTSTQKSFEDQVLVLVNAERAKNGLAALTMDESVRKVARAKSSDMYSKNYFSHTSPTYGSPFDMLKSFGISYKAAGENIAQGYSTPEAVMTGWMNSPGHRANILSKNYTKIGVGYEANGNYWTQEFIG